MISKRTVPNTRVHHKRIVGWRNAAKVVFRKLAFVLLTLSIAGVDCRAAALTAGLTKDRAVHCMQTAVQPVIDGRLDDRCWHTQPALDNLTLAKQSTLARKRTQVFVAYDRRNLYAAFRCAELNSADLKLTEPTRIWRNDSVEVFLDPDRDRESYFHFIVDASGRKLHWIEGIAGRSPDRSWSADWQAAAVRTDSEWTAEIAVPWKSVGVRPYDGLALRANFARNEQRLLERSSWTPRVGGIWNALNFGDLILGDTPLPVRFSTGDSAAVGPGSMKLDVTFKSASSTSLSIAPRFDVSPRCALRRSGLPAVQLRPGQTLESDVSVRIPDERECGLDVWGRINGTGRDAFLGSYRITLPPIRRPVIGARLISTSWASVWEASPMSKVMLDDPLPRADESRIDVFAARNEYEPFQIVITPTHDLKNLRASVDEFKGFGQSARDWITARLVERVPVTQPTDPNCPTGDYPDPLVTFESANASANKNTALWFTVHVPKGAKSGDYLGAVTLQADGVVPVRVPVRLHVWDFDLPDVSRLQTAYGCDYNALCRWDGVSTLEDKRRVVELTNEDFIAHRVAPFDPTRYYGIDTEDKGGTLTADFSEYDTAAEKFLPQMSAFMLPGSFRGGIGNTGRGERGYAGLKRQFLKQLADHLRRKGWLDKGYCYICDEPREEDYQKVVDEAKIWRGADPGLRILLTEQPEEPLFGSVDIWTPVLDMYIAADCRSRQAEGDEVWWYVCTGPRHPYPNNFTDYPALDQRILPWMNWKYGVTGVLYWQTMFWNRDPWTDTMTKGNNNKPLGNGDGQLLYPAARKHSDRPLIAGPVDSIRWEMIREGIEDYDYLYMLKEAVTQAEKNGVRSRAVRDGKAALAQVDVLVRSLVDYEKDPRKYRAARLKMGEALERLHDRSLYLRGGDKSRDIMGWKGSRMVVYGKTDVLFKSRSDAAPEPPITLVPAPKHVEWSGREMPLAPGETAIVIGGSASGPEEYAAETLRQTVLKRFKQDWPVLRESAVQPKYRNLIVLGQSKTSAKVASLCKSWNTDTAGFPDDGYIIAVRDEAGRNTAMVAGTNPRSVIYGQDTLFQLIRRTPNGPVLAAASIRDWPSIPWRGRPQSRNEGHLVPGRFDAYARARINFIDLRNGPNGGQYGYPPGFKIDVDQVKTILKEAHRRGIFVYATVDCAVAPKDFDAVIRTFTELIDLGADGLYISIDDPGAEFRMGTPDALLKRVLELGRRHGMTGPKIAIVPGKESYKEILTDVNRRVAKIPGMETALWFWTVLPSEKALHEAESIGLKSKPAWWHNWPRPQGGLTYANGGVSDRESGNAYKEPTTLAEGWGNPTYADLANAGGEIDAVMPWGGGGWGADYNASAIGWWAWAPKLHDWNTVRARIYDIVFGPDEVEDAYQFDDDLVELRGMFEPPGTGPAASSPPILKNLSDRPKALTLIADMRQILTRLEAGTPKGTLIDVEPLDAWYLRPMNAVLDTAEALANTPFPEYWWDAHTLRVMRSVRAGDLDPIPAWNEESKARIEGETAEVDRRLSGVLRGIGDYTAWWRGQFTAPVEAPHIASAPKLTGDLSDPLWRQALKIDDLRIGGRKPVDPTEIRLMYTDQDLYVGATCFEPHPESLVVTQKGRDSDTWMDDSVEVFLNPDSLGDRVYQFVVNPDGCLLDGRKVPGGTSDPHWNSSAEVKTARGKDRWTAEFRIPLRDVGVHGSPAGQVWLCNFARNDHVGPFLGMEGDNSGDTSSWSGAGSNHDTSRYRPVKFRK